MRSTRLESRSLRCESGVSFTLDRETETGVIMEDDEDDDIMVDGKRIEAKEMSCKWQMVH